MHRDYIQETRAATIIIFLADVEEGGETEFSELGLSVKPQRGSLVTRTHVRRCTHGRNATRTR